MRLLRNLLLPLLLSSPAQALVLDAPLADPNREAQARELFQSMRCIVCEGQSLAESDAAFAIQMRSEIRRLLGDGQSPQQVRDYFTARYGEEILLGPRFSLQTAPLWLMPLALLILALFFLVRTQRRSA